MMNIGDLIEFRYSVDTGYMSAPDCGIIVGSYEFDGSSGNKWATKLGSLELTGPATIVSGYLVLAKNNIVKVPFRFKKIQNFLKFETFEAL